MKSFLTLLLYAACLCVKATGFYPVNPPIQFVATGSTAFSLPTVLQDFYYFTNYAGGSATANVSNLVFTLTNTPDFAPPAITPYSPIVLTNEDFQSGLGGLKVTLAGSGTMSASGGLFSYIGTSTAFILSETNSHFISPQAVVGVSVLAITNCNLTLTLTTPDGLTGIILGYDGSSLSVSGVTNGGAPTSIIASQSFTPSGSFSIAIDVMNNIVNVWTNTGNSWGVFTGARITFGSYYDLRSSNNLAAWSPGFYAFNGGGAMSVYITNFSSTYENGPGTTREVSSVHNLDVTQIVTNSSGQSLLGLDHSVLDRNNDSDPSTSFQIHPYDSVTRTLYPATVNVGGVFSNTPATTCEPAVVYDSGLNGYHIFSDDFTVINGGTKGVGLWYGFIPASQFHGMVNVQLNRISIVSDGVSAGQYGPDVCYFSPHWYMAFTEDITNGAGADFIYTRLVRGNSPTNFDTQIATDLSHENEGVNFFTIGTNLQIVAGSRMLTNSVLGLSQVYDISNNFAAMNYLGFLSASNLMTNSSPTLPQQPGLFLFPNPQGSSTIQFFGFTDDYYQGQYATGGRFFVQGTQWRQIHVQR